MYKFLPIAVLITSEQGLPGPNQQFPENLSLQVLSKQLECFDTAQKTRHRPEKSQYLLH